MRYKGKDYRTVWFENGTVSMIDQNKIPCFEIYRCKSYLDTCEAIKDMTVRGAGAIGAAAGFAMAQVFLEKQKIDEDFLREARNKIKSTRPTARNLGYAVDRVYDRAIRATDPRKKAVEEAQKIADEDVEASRKIGEYGSGLIKDKYKIMTHCNAGALAFVDNGTALSPIYSVFRNGMNVFVYVSKTGPRGQGAKLTSFELINNNIEFVIFEDSASAHFLKEGGVDLIIVGADRIARNGDVANKIGTLDKAILAKEFNVPFYVAAPTSTIDTYCNSGEEIKVEYRSEDEVLYQTGHTKDGRLERILVATPGSRAINPAFDITDAKYITDIITEYGIIKADKNGERMKKELSKLLNKIKGKNTH